jgi:dolichol-phosphate mannosyltransferase
LRRHVDEAGSALEGLGTAEGQVEVTSIDYPLAQRATDAAEATRSAPRALFSPVAPNVFVIPAYNEEPNLPRLLADLEARPALFPSGSRILIVDDGSSDRTPEIVTSYDGPLPLELLRFEQNQGPGAAFRAGFANALERCPDNALVITLEADTTSDLDALPQMIDRAEAGAELVLANWEMVNVSRRRRLLSAAAGWVVRRALGVDATTVSSFFRVYSARTLRAGFDRHGDSFVREPGFACKAEILAKLARMGARIEEVEVKLDWARREGESKMPVFRTMVAYWRMLFRQRASRATASA